MLAFKTVSFLPGFDVILPVMPWHWTLSDLTAETAAFTLLLGLIGLAGLEFKNPKKRLPLRRRLAAYLTNLGLFGLNSMLLSACSVASLYWIAAHFGQSGILQSLSNPAIQGLLAFLAIDLLLYLWHFICHRYDGFWLFHRVHHNDPHVNVTTAFRLHIVEMLITHALKALLIVALGIDKVMVLFIETVTTFSVMFHHTNTTLPFERQLGRVMISPYLHRLHHSTERSEHDSNYGAVLSIWDQLFGTLQEKEAVAIGIKGESPQDLMGLMKYGFGLTLPEPASEISHPVDLETMIAVAAYYRAEKRDFMPGDDQRDWHEAKADILSRFQPAPAAERPAPLLAGWLNWGNWFQQKPCRNQRGRQEKFHCLFG